MSQDKSEMTIVANPSLEPSLGIVRGLRRTITDARRAVSRLEPLLTTEHLSLEEWLILDVLSELDGVSMSQLAAETLASNATLSRHVDSLVSRAAIYRQVGPEDRRQYLVFLSTRGRALHGFMSDQIRRLSTDA
jgi:DNA-binding MarR family transcriptional regulator